MKILLCNLQLVRSQASWRHLYGRSCSTDVALDAVLVGSGGLVQICNFREFCKELSSCTHKITFTPLTVGTLGAEENFVAVPECTSCRFAKSNDIPKFCIKSIPKIGRAISAKINAKVTDLYFAMSSVKCVNRGPVSCY